MMVATMQQIIGKVNPWLYAENCDDLLKKYKTPDKIPASEVKPKNLGEHSLTYDSSSETLEPIYFFILDLMSDFGLSPEKYSDTFASTPGSGHFGELGQRATVMQQQGAKILGDINTVLRSILNIIYDLREFKIRLDSYDKLKSRDNSEKDAAVLSLKQIWMDKVDINKGNSSIKAMALGQAGFQTLIDAFLFAKTPEQAEKIDLNERVKRILMPRVLEFNKWMESSDQELRKRYEIEKTYLKSQVNSLKIYSRWAKPYLRAAAQLEMKDMGREPALVKTFSTILLELTLMGKSKLKVRDLAMEGKLPKEFQSMITKRDYSACILVDFRFRGMPQRINQQSHYVFGGKAIMTFTAYALNSEELAKVNEEADKSDIGDVLGLIEGATTESLDNLKADIDFFLGEEKHEHKDERKSSGTNPFLALFGAYNKKDEEEKHDRKKDDKSAPIAPDSWVEKEFLRRIASDNAEEMVFKLFDVYKNAHGVPSYT